MRQLLCGRLSGVACGIAVLLAAGLGTGLGLGAGSTPERPTPAGWDQWQPEQDSSDPRLERRCLTVWAEEISLSDLLGRIGEACGVALTAEAELRDTHLSVFAQDCTPAGLMVSLAGLLEGYWLYPREQVGEARGYRLVPAVSFVSLLDWEEWRYRPVHKALREQARPEREARLDLYAEALKLSPEELLARHEESDPWLCVDLLDPRSRPLVELLCGLSEADREELLSTGSYVRPLRRLPPAFCAELGRLVGSGTDPGAHGFGSSQPGANPDRLSRFTRPEDRWDNAAVWFSCDERGVFFSLDIPDLARLFKRPIFLASSIPPGDRRRRLVEFGYREDTPEYRKAAEAEEKLWHEANPEWLTGPSHDAPRVKVLGRELNLEEPRLKQELDLSALAGGDLSVPAVLEEAARQCDLAVLAHCLPGEKGRLRPLETESAEDQTVTLGTLLEGLRRGDPAWLWRFYGRYLTVRYLYYRGLEAGQIPEDLLAELAAKLRPGASFSLEEGAALMAGLNMWQIERLTDKLELYNTPLYHWHTYGLIQGALGTDERQREALRSAGGLPVTALGTELQKEILGGAKGRRPWLEWGDFSSTTLRIIPRRFSTGEEGLSLILDYHLPDSPRDREIFFTSPFQVTVRGG